MLDALLSAEEPVTGTDGTMSWTVDVKNPATGDDAALVLKELQMPDGQRRPYAMALYGDYPRDLDGLCRLLSLDMRVIDPAWIGAKLAKLLSFPETGGTFLGRVPGAERAAVPVHGRLPGGAGAAPLPHARHPRRVWRAAETARRAGVTRSRANAAAARRPLPRLWRARRRAPRGLPELHQLRLDRQLRLAAQPGLPSTRGRVSTGT